MSNPPEPSSETILACMTCGQERTVSLDPVQLARFLGGQEVRDNCPACGTVTAWYVVPGKQGAQKAADREAREARIELPLRLRCDTPELKFIEFTRTLTASKRGASFITAHALREGMQVHVIVPFREGDTTLMEVQAKVVRVEAKDKGFEVGVQFVE